MSTITDKITKLINEEKDNINKLNEHQTEINKLEVTINNLTEQYKKSLPQYTKLIQINKILKETYNIINNLKTQKQNEINKLFKQRAKQLLKTNNTLENFLIKLDNKNHIKNNCSKTQFLNIPFKNIIFLSSTGKRILYNKCDITTQWNITINNNLINNIEANLAETNKNNQINLFKYNSNKLLITIHTFNDLKIISNYLKNNKNTIKIYPSYKNILQHTLYDLIFYNGDFYYQKSLNKVSKNTTILIDKETTLSIQINNISL